MSWVPMFSKIVDSSLWAEPDNVVKVFLTMLAKKGPDQIVRGNAFEIGRWANKSEKEALAALKVLASPDRRRLEPQPYDGRRIEKVEGGWKILNGQFYEEEMRKTMERARKARWARENREREREMERYRKPSKLSPGERLCANGDVAPGVAADHTTDEMARNRAERRRKTAESGADV